MKTVHPLNPDPARFSTWTWKHPYMLHWIINPGPAVIELALGQRIPKVILVEKDRKKSLAERSYIPCPHCNTLHSGLKWSPQNKTAYRNWFGYYCDNCEKIIPCLWNATSLVLLAITFPIWIWFVKSWKKKWLAEQKLKFAKQFIYTPPEFNWWKTGLSFGLSMFVMMELIFTPLIDGEGIKLRSLIIAIPIWTLGGLSFGWFMKKIAAKPLDKKIQEPGK